MVKTTSDEKKTPCVYPSPKPEPKTPSGRPRERQTKRISISSAAPQDTKEVKFVVHQVEKVAEDAPEPSSAIRNPPTEKTNSERPAFERPILFAPLVDETPFVPPNVTEYLKETGRLKTLKPWSREDLDNLYKLLNMYGTSDEAIEFIAENGMDKPLEEIQEKMREIRQLIAESKAVRIDAFRNHYEAKARRVTNSENLAELLPVDDGAVINQWSAAALQVSGQYRQFNHAVVRNAITSCLDAVPATKYDEVTATTSKMAKRPGLKESLDYGNIVNFLQKVNSQTVGANNVTDLNPLESAVLLNILQEIEEEAFSVLSLRQKAVIRGMLRSVKAQNFKDFNPDTPCNELSATQAYIDPFRTRDWDIPYGGRKLTRRDVDARRPLGDPDVIDHDDDNEDSYLMRDETAMNVQVKQGPCEDTVENTEAAMKPSTSSDDLPMSLEDYFPEK